MNSKIESKELQTEDYNRFRSVLQKFDYKINIKPYKIIVTKYNLTWDEDNCYYLDPIGNYVKVADGNKKTLFNIINMDEDKLTRMLLSTTDIFRSNERRYLYDNSPNATRNTSHQRIIK